MRAEHYPFHVLEVTSKSRVRLVDSNEISLSPTPSPVGCYCTDRPTCKAVIYVLVCYSSRYCMSFFVSSNMLFQL